jgi:hypothetical protein
VVKNITPQNNKIKIKFNGKKSKCLRGKKKEMNEIYRKNKINS